MADDFKITQRGLVADLALPQLPPAAVDRLSAELSRRLDRDLERAFGMASPGVAVVHHRNGDPRDISLGNLEIQSRPRCSCGPFFHHLECRYAGIS